MVTTRETSTTSHRVLVLTPQIHAALPFTCASKSLVLGEEFQGPFELLIQNLMVPLTPYFHRHLVRQRAHQIRRRKGVDIQRAALDLFKFKGPQQFGRHTPHASFCQMDSWTHSPACPIAVVMYKRLACSSTLQLGHQLISILPVSANCILVRQLLMIDKAVGVESVGVGIQLFILVNRVCGQPDSAVFGEEHAIVPVVCCR